jgi:hypothetical protein
MTPEQPDPLLASLAALSRPTPAKEREVRVRTRCHAILAASPGRARAPRSRTQHAVDAGLAIAASLYGVMTIVEAVRIARLLL